VAWSAAEFQGFRHGYAGTIYKGQGKTLDHTYLYHSRHWRRAASYVALTRQRASARVFVARETARDARDLARQMARGDVRAASMAWATADERALTVQPESADTPRLTDRMAGRREEARVPAGDRPGSGEVWLIPPRVSPDGRDSLGRGLDPGSVAAAVAADRKVQREREALVDYLRGAYRDPLAAKAHLSEWVKREGWTRAAARVAAEPEQLGELRGREGWLAGAAARQERAAAERAAVAVAPGLERVGTAEEQAERGYRQAVAAQRVADGTGIPRLSDSAPHPGRADCCRTTTHQSFDDSA
jgi:hypothetical protein